jgi:hypothetical protein
VVSIPCYSRPRCSSRTAPFRLITSFPLTLGRLGQIFVPGTSGRPSMFLLLPCAGTKTLLFINTISGMPSHSLGTTPSVHAHLRLAVSHRDSMNKLVLNAAVVPEFHMRIPFQPGGITDTLLPVARPDSVIKASGTLFNDQFPRHAADNPTNHTGFSSSIQQQQPTATTTR